MRYLGFDPGAKGGVAIIDTEHSICEAWRYPGDVSEMAKLVRQIISDYGEIDLACVEQVHAMPGNGATSMFKFGTNFGSILGILSALSIPYVMCTPRKWQKEMLDAGTGETKERSLNMARRLYPHVDLRYKADDGKADAIHIARYIAEKDNK